MNLPTLGGSGTAQDGRNAEKPTYIGGNPTPFTDVVGEEYLGMNNAGGCNPGIGIATETINPKDQDWSLLDIDGNPRYSQQSDLIGAITEPADPDGTHNPGQNFINVLTDTFLIEQVGFVAADQDAAIGAIAHTPTGIKNISGQDVVVGDRLWGYD